MEYRSLRNQCDTVCGNLALARDTEESLQNQIFVFFREAILSGRIPSGLRIPSSRRLAAEQGISRTTVVEAYERLGAEGYIVARARAGIFVSDVLPEEFLVHGTDSPGQANACRTFQRKVRSAPRRPSGEKQGYQLPLAPGIPALDHFPCDVWARLGARVLRRHSARVVGWGEPRGELPLREAIAEYLGAARGIACSPDHIVVASGSRPIVETVARAVANPGDAVWFEEPGDPAARAVLSALGLDPVPVRVDEQGLDVADGRRAAPEARLAVVAPSHHYPLGVTMSLARRRALLEWADTAGAWVVENEIDGDYRFVRHAPPPLYTLDVAQRVVYLGSFNKSLAPGLRVGYAVVPDGLIDAFANMSPMVSVQDQLLLARFCEDGYLASHLRYLREVHARRRSLLIAALRGEAEGLLQVEEPPEAGLRFPVTLACDLSDDDIGERCLASGIKVGRPLSKCYAGVVGKFGLSIGFASTREEKILPAVRKLVGVFRSDARFSIRRGIM